VSEEDTDSGAGLETVVEVAIEEAILNCPLGTAFRASLAKKMRQVGQHWSEELLCLRGDRNECVNNF
jgi:hypothetical protein